MKPDIKIFISTHRSDVHFPDNKYLYPIQVGTTNDKCFPNMLHDNEGDNIASKNGSYCELTAQYYVYKNVDADYYGFFHYRRYFNFSETKYPIVIKPFICGDILAPRNDDEYLKRYCVDEEHILKALDGADYVAPYLIDASDGASIYEQYRNSFDHYVSDLDAVMDIIKADYPDIWPSALEYLNNHRSYLCNMFIMKKELFMEYSSFLFDVLKKHEALCNIPEYSPIAGRVSGYLGERLCGIFLTYLKSKGYKGKELQRVFFEEFRTPEAIEAEPDKAPKSAQTSLKAKKYEPVDSSYFDKHYEDWFLANRVTDSELSAQREAAFEVNPKYSIIVPLYNTPIEFFDEMLASVVGQSYGNFELILVNASKDNSKLVNHVADAISDYSNVKQIVLDGNYGITENTNYGIKEATGDFLCFLDHDDTLELDILYEYTKALNDNPDIDLFYCDEDKLMAKKYVDPFFKPDWNIDYLNTLNYVCHFLTVRKSILDSMELPTSEYDGSQDYHMTYRIGEKARAICHVPKILYHWRIHSGSTAASATQKDYTYDSSVVTIEKHLERTGVKGTVLESHKRQRRFTIRYDVPVSIISVIIRYDGNVDRLNRCLTSVRRLIKKSNDDYDALDRDISYEIVITGEKASLNKIDSYITRHKKLDPTLKVVACDTVDESVISAASVASGEYLLIVDSSVEFLRGTWAQLVGTTVRNDVIMAGPRFLIDDTYIDSTGLGLSNKGIVKYANTLHHNDGASLDRFVSAMDVDAISGKCFAIRKSTLLKFGLDSSIDNLMYQGIDLGIRAHLENPKANIIVDPTVDMISHDIDLENIDSNNEVLLNKHEFLRDIKTSTYNPNLLMYEPYDLIDYGDLVITEPKPESKAKQVLRRAYNKLR